MIFQLLLLLLLLALLVSPFVEGVFLDNAEALKLSLFYLLTGGSFSKFARAGIPKTLTWTLAGNTCAMHCLFSPSPSNTGCRPVEVPSTHLGLVEDVAEITGLALPAIFEQKTTIRIAFTDILIMTRICLLQLLLLSSPGCQVTCENLRILFSSPANLTGHGTVELEMSMSTEPTIGGFCSKFMVTLTRYL